MAGDDIFRIYLQVIREVFKELFGKIFVLKVLRTASALRRRRRRAPGPVLVSPRPRLMLVDASKHAR